MDTLSVDTGRDGSESVRDVMVQISQFASTTRDLAGLFRLISQRIGLLTAADHFIIALHHPQQDSHRIIFADNQYLPNPSAYSGYTEAITVIIRENKPIQLPVSQDETTHPGYTTVEVELPGCWMGVPFNLSGEVIKGCMIIHNTTKEKPFTKDDLTLLQFAASQAVVAIYRNKSELWRDENAHSFQGVLTAAPMGMHLYSFDPDQHLVFIGANPAADQVLQTDHSFLMGKMIEEVLPDLINTDVPEQFHRIARDGGVFQTEQIIYEQGQIHKAFQISAFQTEPGKIAAMFCDIGEIKRKEESLRMRDGILSAAAYAGEQFLECSNWTEKIELVLERLGEVTGSSRVFLSENKIYPEGETSAIQKYEWRLPGLAASINSPWAGAFSFSKSGFHHWAEAMINGEVIHRLVKNLPAEEARVLEQYQIKSIAAAPILIDKYWWGLIGFENHAHERIFNAEVLESIKSAAKTIAASIMRTNKDSSLLERATRADALVKTAALLNTSLEPESVIETVCSEAARGLNAQIVSIYLYNEESKALHCAGGYNLVENCLNIFDPIPLDTLNEYLNLKSSPILLKDPASIQHFFHSPVQEILNIHNIVSWVILFDQKLIGILNILLEDDQRKLTTEEFDYLEGLTHEAALAINNARLLFTEKIRSKELGTLYDLSVDLNTSLSVDDALEITLSSVQDLLEADAGMIVLHDEGKSILSIPFATGYLAANTGHIFNWQETLDGFKQASIRAESTLEFSTQPGIFSGLKGIKLCGSATTIPLLSANEPVGIAVATRKKNGDLKPLTPFDQRLLRAIGELAGTTVRKAQFYEDGQRRLTFLQALRTIDIEISTNLKLNSTLKIVLDEVVANLKVDAVAALVINPESGKLKFGAQKGFSDINLYRLYLERNESYAELAAFDRRMFLLPDIRGKQTNFIQSELFLVDQFVAYAAVPLLAKGEVRGVLEIFSKKPFQVNQEWLEFLETLAGQTAIAIDHTTLFENLQRSNAELLKAYDITIEGWSSALDLKDSDTEGHTRRVADMTERLARALGIADGDLVHLRRGALLHDIGKMGVPDQILRKPGPLNDDEWKVMKKHPVYAYEWLSPAEYLHPALDIPYSHHEKWDGTGYPQGLQGDKIPLKARIFSLVDVWDALSSDRPYRKRWQQDEVTNYIRDQSSTYFDPEIVPVFLDLLNDQDFVQ